jgi:hypothetical protein
MGLDIVPKMLYTIRASPKEYAPKVVPPDPREQRGIIVLPKRRERDSLSSVAEQHGAPGRPE